MRTILVHPLTVNLHTNKLAVTNTYSRSSTVHIHDILLSHHHLLLLTDEFNISLITFCFINRVLADTTTNHVFSRHEFFWVQIKLTQHFHLLFRLLIHHLLHHYSKVHLLCFFCSLILQKHWWYELDRHYNQQTAISTLYQC